MAEDKDHNEQGETSAPQESSRSSEPLPPPPPSARSVTPTTPQAPVQPSEQNASQEALDSEQPPQQQLQGQFPPPNQTPDPNKNKQPDPTFRENGAFSFFATPSDPDDDPAPMSWGFKIGWFVLGLLGGMLGLVMAWLSTSTLSSKRRRQALIWTWAGFACQAVAFLIMVLTGGSAPFMPTGTSTGAQSAGSAGSGSTSAFG